MQFPNMHSGEFPHIDNVNVNKWINDFEYQRYDYTQMRIQICAVPWDMGEAHVGNRTISGIGNVVYFGSKEKRDEWFASIPDSQCFRFETKYKELHKDNYIDVPLPFDIAATFNYIAVEYSLFANDDSPVMYESENGHRKWFWFIREVEFLAPNTTRLHLLPDAFQTWIYDVNVSGMMLERGHAPMFETTIEEYLADPIDNSFGLLAEDVNYGTSDIARSSHEFVFNAKDMYALVITAANVLAEWGAKADSDWTTPGRIFSTSTTEGIPTYYPFLVPASDFTSFMTNVNSYVPQFVQTVKCVAFVSSDLVTVGESFTFAETTCYRVTSSYKNNQIIESYAKADFGYDYPYSEITKLYTYPYAYIILTDEQGNQTEIRIENTDGHISLQTNVNLVFPWLNVSGYIEGVGKAAKKNITFATMTQRNMPISGNWYELLMQWDIPTFGVFQDAGKNNDYATYYDRVQRVNDYTTEQTNQNALADTAISNATLTNAANSAITATSNDSAWSVAGNTYTYNSAMAGNANLITNANANSTIAANEAQGSISAASQVGTSAASAVSSAMSGDIGHGASSLVSGAIGAAATMASASVGNWLTAGQAGNAMIGNNANATTSSQKTQADTTAQTTAASDITDTHNDLNTAVTANNAATQKANAARNATNAQNAINNQIAQADMNAPVEFGAFNNGDSVAVRPMGLFANIVTQTDSAIRNAGDEFLRYGYMYGKYWNFDGDWNIGKHFTYWKLKDFWVSNLNVPDMYMDRLRFFLMGGVTVWRKPEDIGHVSIYDNI